MYSGRVRLSRTATSPDSGETRRSAPRTSLHVRLIQPLQAKTPGHTGAPRSRHAAARHGHKQGAMPSNPARSCPGDARPADSMTKRGCLFRQAVPSGRASSRAGRSYRQARHAVMRDPHVAPVPHKGLAKALHTTRDRVRDATASPCRRHRSAGLPQGSGRKKREHSSTKPARSDTAPTPEKCPHHSCFRIISYRISCRPRHPDRAGCSHARSGVRQRLPHRYRHRDACRLCA